jgi:hypothetical protein
MPAFSDAIYRRQGTGNPQRTLHTPRRVTRYRTMRSCLRSPEQELQSEINTL